MAKQHSILCDCKRCFAQKYPFTHAANQEKKRRGGTMNSSAFPASKSGRGDGKRDHYFNGPGDGKRHGHVVEGEQRGTYHYARDVEGNVYINRRKKP